MNGHIVKRPAILVLAALVLVPAAHARLAVGVNADAGAVADALDREDPHKRIPARVMPDGSLFEGSLPAWSEPVPAATEDVAGGRSTY